MSTEAIIGSAVMCLLIGNKHWRFCRFGQRVDGIPKTYSNCWPMVDSPIVENDTLEYRVRECKDAPRHVHTLDEFVSDEDLISNNIDASEPVAVSQTIMTCLSDVRRWLDANAIDNKYSDCNDYDDESIEFTLDDRQQIAFKLRWL
jgi:hypothetical protein